MNQTGRGRGFSLVELLVSASILTVAILLIVGIFTMLLNSSQKTVDLTAGSVLAESLLSQEVQQLTYNPSGASQFYQFQYTVPTVAAGGSYNLNTASYYYKIYVGDVAFDTLSGPNALTLHSDFDNPTTNNTRLKRLDIVLWWWDDAAGSAGSASTMTVHTSHSGAGQLQVHMGRLLWPSANY